MGSWDLKEKVMDFNIDFKLDRHLLKEAVIHVGSLTKAIKAGLPIFDDKPKSSVKKA
jgi:hypothetical protein